MRTCSRTPNAPINAKAVVSGCWLGPVGSEWRKRGGPPLNPTATVRQEFTRAPPASPLGGGAALGAEHRGGEGRWGAGADAGLRRSGSVRVEVLPQPKAALRAASRRLREHQPRQRMQENPSPAASPEPGPLLHLLRAPKCSEPDSVLPHPPATCGKTCRLLREASSYRPHHRYRDTARQPAAAGPGKGGGGGGCSGRVPAGRLPRPGRERSNPARGNGGPTLCRAQHTERRLRAPRGKGREGTGGSSGRRLPWMPVW